MTNWVMWLLLGILLVVGGLSSLMNPFAATVTAEILAAWLFIVSGALQIFMALKLEKFDGKIWMILGGVVALIVGMALLLNPLRGIVALTMVVGVLFLLFGGTKIFAALSQPLRATSLFLGVLISGILSGLLGVLILTTLPGSALFTLGLILAIELISSGIAVIAVAFQIKAANYATV